MKILKANRMLFSHSCSLLYVFDPQISRFGRTVYLFKEIRKKYFYFCSFDFLLSLLLLLLSNYFSPVSISNAIIETYEAKEIGHAVRFCMYTLCVDEMNRQTPKINNNKFSVGSVRDIFHVGGGVRHKRASER